MFEKEAEEWVKNNLHSTEEDYIKAFKDGAEFGYNKAKKEIETLKKNNVEITEQWCKEQQNVYDLEQEIFNLKEPHKANEWHYVKDGDLPKDEFIDEYKHPRLPSAYKRHYCLYLGDNESVMGKYIKGSFLTAEGRYSLDEVVAWKEIVLPKESE